MKHLLLTTTAAVMLVGCMMTQLPKISIHEAVENGDIKTIKQHLAAGTDVNAAHDDYLYIGITPLHWAKNKEVAELLITEGADVNAKNKAGITPLHGAVQTGNKEIAELLIDKGANVNVKEMDGGTPLDLILETNNGSLFFFDTPNTKASKKEIADLLRKHGGKTGEELKAEEK